MSVNDLIDKYEAHPYMLRRLQTHLANLPAVLEQEHKKYEERICRINELTLEQDNFDKVFLSRHQYFYMPYNNLYYEYDGKTYKLVKDDDIHYKLLSTITDEGKLIQWKHKTKYHIIKKIKERSLSKSTPETYTIQRVLGFLQTIFQNKTEAKYFLTIIGDCIFKKNTNYLYFVSSALKKCMMLIDTIVYNTTGTSIIHHFITKYHDTHKLHLYRLIKINETANSLSVDIINDILNTIGIDLFCVATHYSDRYVSSDNYLNTKVEADIKNHALYFTNNSLETVVNDFINQCIDFVTPPHFSESVNTHTISWKNMHYIWKMYLSNVQIPNMIYSQQLQELLISKLKGNYVSLHTADGGSVLFTNVTSKYLPKVSSFLSFWDKHIVFTDAEEEYEIDELMTLYKNYSDTASSTATTMANKRIIDTDMIKMIWHYYSPQVEIIDNKYITNIKCLLWNKNDEVRDFLQSYKVNANKTELQTDIINFDDLYQSYKKYINAKTIVENKISLIVSKHYFEKYILNQLSDFVQFDKFVSSEWLLS